MTFSLHVEFELYVGFFFFGKNIEIVYFLGLDHWCTLHQVEKHMFSTSASTPSEAL
jgi:hypothetical protein